MPGSRRMNFCGLCGRMPQQVTENAAPKNGAHLIRIMQTLQDGQSKDDLPEEIRPKSGYGNTYAKLWWERPSTTITRNFACPLLPLHSPAGFPRDVHPAGCPVAKASRMITGSMAPMV